MLYQDLRRSPAFILDRGLSRSVLDETGEDLRIEPQFLELKEARKYFIFCGMQN